MKEIFYGDCAPNLERPAKIGWGFLFKYLMNREELEYHLATDMENYGKRYKANLDSRWNTPEFGALAADAVRKLQVLQSTKVFWAKNGASFSRDMKILAKTTDKDFEDVQLVLVGWWWFRSTAPLYYSALLLRSTDLVVTSAELRAKS